MPRKKLIHVDKVPTNFDYKTRTTNFTDCTFTDGNRTINADDFCIKHKLIIEVMTDLHQLNLPLNATMEKCYKSMQHAYEQNHPDYSGAKKLHYRGRCFSYDDWENFLSPLGKLPVRTVKEHMKQGRSCDEMLVAYSFFINDYQLKKIIPTKTGYRTKNYTIGQAAKKDHSDIYENHFEILQHSLAIRDFVEDHRCELTKAIGDRSYPMPSETIEAAMKLGLVNDNNNYMRSMRRRKFGTKTQEPRELNASEKDGLEKMNTYLLRNAGVIIKSWKKPRR